MAGWAAGISAAISAALDIAGTTANIVNQQQVNKNNQHQLQIQQQLASQQVQAIVAQTEAYTKLNNPIERYRLAVDAGYGIDGASQFAGRSAPHIVGATAVGPLLQREQDAIRVPARPISGFTHVGGRQVTSRTQMMHDWLDGVQKPTLTRPRRLSTTSSVWSNSTQTTRLTGSSNASSTSEMVVSPSRPIMFNKGKTQFTWVPGSSA
uniref:VP2 n=1 Tax=Bat calicivirus TaxID=1514705 RepID=A0A0D3MCD0_9CALI|nr:VP2 [Bat calicivirus]